MLTSVKTRHVRGSAVFLQEARNSGLSVVVTAYSDSERQDFEVHSDTPQGKSFNSARLPPFKAPEIRRLFLIADQGDTGAAGGRNRGSASWPLYSAHGIG